MEDLFQKVYSLIIYLEMEKEYFRRSVRVIVIFAFVAIAMFLTVTKITWDDIERRSESLEARRQRVAVTGYIAPTLRELGIGSREPYWAALYIYSKIDLFPQVNGAVLDDLGRTVGHVSVEFFFDGDSIEPERADVSLSFGEEQVKQLAAGDGRLNKLIAEAFDLTAGGGGLEINKSISLTGRKEVGLSRSAYSTYFRSVATEMIQVAGKLVSDDEWLSNYQTEPTFQSLDSGGLDLTGRYRLISRADQLFVVELNEKGDEMVGISVWPVPERGISDEEAIRTARARWVKAKTPEIMQSVEGTGGSTWTFDETTGCMTAEFTRSQFVPAL